MHVQYQQCANEFGVEVEHWTPRTSTMAPPTFLLATIDQAMFAPFKRLVSMLVQNSWLACIVINEAHLILTHADF